MRSYVITLTLLLVIAPFLALGGTLASCGGASTATRSAYAVEVTHCTSNERTIVDRAGTTAEQDQHDLLVERARCDAALHAIEEGDGHR